MDEKTLPYEDKVENFTKNLARILQQSLEKFFLENPDWSGVKSTTILADDFNDSDVKFRVDFTFARTKKDEKTGKYEGIE